MSRIFLEKTNQSQAVREINKASREADDCLVFIKLVLSQIEYRSSKPFSVQFGSHHGTELESQRSSITKHERRHSEIKPRKTPVQKWRRGTDALFVWFWLPLYSKDNILWSKCQILSADGQRNWFKHEKVWGTNNSASSRFGKRQVVILIWIYFRNHIIHCCSKERGMKSIKQKSATIYWLGSHSQKIR